MPVADATGSYATAYNIAGGLLMFAFLLAAIGYINVSVSVPERAITIQLGKKKETEAGAPAAEAASPRLVATATDTVRA